MQKSNPLYSKKGNESNVMFKCILFGTTIVWTLLHDVGFEEAHVDRSTRPDKSRSHDLGGIRRGRNSLRLWKTRTQLVPAKFITVPVVVFGGNPTLAGDRDIGV